MLQFPRKATIIGHTGFVGSSLAKYLKSLGTELLLPAKGKESELEGSHLGVLYFCAGKTSNFLYNPHETIWAHVGLLSSLIQRCKFDRIIYLSSTRLGDNFFLSNNIDYNSTSQRPFSSVSPLLLNSLNPRHLFDISKALGESLCFSVAPELSISLRLSCVWDLQKQSSGFLTDLFRLFGEGSRDKSSPVFINSCPNISRHYVELKVLIRFMTSLGCATTNLNTAIINCASDASPVSNSSLAAIFSRIFEVDYIFNSQKSDPYPTIPSLDLSDYLLLSRLYGCCSEPFLDRLNFVLKQLVP